MKGWVGLVGWPVADGYHIVVIRRLQSADRGTGSVHRPETGVLSTMLRNQPILSGSPDSIGFLLSAFRATDNQIQSNTTMHHYWIHSTLYEASSLQQHWFSCFQQPHVEEGQVNGGVLGPCGPDNRSSIHICEHTTQVHPDCVSSEIASLWQYFWQ